MNQYEIGRMVQQTENGTSIWLKSTPEERESVKDWNTWSSLIQKYGDIKY